MESRGTAAAFFLILAIVCTGAYWAYQSLRSGGSLVSLGGAEVIRPTAISVATALPTVTPLIPSPTETPLFVPPTAAVLTLLPTSTPLPPIGVATQLAAPSPSSPESTPSPSPLLPESTEEITATVEPTASPTETPLPPTPAFLFQPGFQGPNFERGCNGYYIFGYVRDSTGALLAGVLIHVFDQYGNDLGVTPSKDAPDLGYYNFPISGVRDTWTVQIVDENGEPLSPPVEVLNTGGFVPGQEACWHQVDWVRQ